MSKDRNRVLVIGAAGRDFQNFNTVSRDDKHNEVVAFTAAQIPGAAWRKYPSMPAGKHQPNGNDALPEHDLEITIKDRQVDEAVLAYSDISHVDLMHNASSVLERPGREAKTIQRDGGPTITHVGMPYGAGYVAASDAHAAEIVDPWQDIEGEIAKVFAIYPHIGRVLQAIVSTQQEPTYPKKTIDTVKRNVVVAGAPVDLKRQMKLNKPVVRARYEFVESGAPTLARHVGRFMKSRKPMPTLQQPAFAA